MLRVSTEFDGQAWRWFYLRFGLLEVHMETPLRQAKEGWLTLLDIAIEIFPGRFGQLVELHFTVLGMSLNLTILKHWREWGDG